MKFNMPEKITLYGLAYSCPHLERQDDCPFMHVKHLSFQEKVKWIDNLNEEERKIILEHHQRCSKNR
jgi:hypothetical protein